MCNPSHLTYHVLLQKSREVLYIDRGNFAQNGIRYAGATVVTLDRMMWAQSLKGWAPGEAAHLPMSEDAHNFQSGSFM